jgi:hypothetical protein
MTIANQDFEVDEGASSTIAIPLTSNGAPYAVPVGSIIDWWASPSQFDAAGAVPIKNYRRLTRLVVSTVSGQSTLYVAVYSTDTSIGVRRSFSIRRGSSVLTVLWCPCFRGL